MIKIEDAADRLHTILEMIAHQRDARKKFDLSEDSVFESLWAMVLAIGPILLFSLAAREAILSLESTDTPSIMRAPTIVYLAFQLFTSFATWAASLAILVFIARQIGEAKQAAHLIISVNWLNLLVYLTNCVPVVAFLITQSAPTFVVLLMPVAIINFLFLWRIIRTVLPINIGSTVSILCVVILSELILNQITSTLADLFVS